MRFVSLTALALLGCNDAELGSLDIGEVETSRTVDESEAATQVVRAFVPVDAPVAGSVSMDAEPHRLDGEVLSGEPELPENSLARPVAVIFVVDQNADMADVGHLLNEPAIVGVRALLESPDESWAGIVGHVDRRAHQLFALEEAKPANARLLFGGAASLTTCSTLEDMPGWSESGTHYDHPVLLAPPCWADEVGRDPATALAFAHHLLERDAPADAEKAIVWIGGRPPEAIEESTRRPDNYMDQMQTWKRTDREISQDILVAHTSFVVAEIQDEGVHMLHVPLDEAATEGWLAEAGAPVAPGGQPHERADAVYDFVQQLRVLARE